MQTGIIMGKRVIGFTMAGGKGFDFFNDRLHQPVIPEPKNPRNKCAMLLGNKTVIDHSLEAAKKAGISEMFINIHTHAESIRNYRGLDVFRTSEMRIELVEEARLYGTAGSMKNMALDERTKLQDGDIVVCQNGDSVHNLDILPVIKAHIENLQRTGKPGLTAVFMPAEWDLMNLYGSVRVKGAGLIQVMPKRGDYVTQKQFEAATEKWFADAMLTGQRYFEMEAYAEKLPRAKCLSHLNDLSIYVMDYAFMRDFFPHITRPVHLGEKDIPGKFFNDISKHVIPWALGASPWPSSNAGKYSMRAYLMNDGYFLDIGTRKKFWSAAMDLLAGLFDSGLEDSPFWTRRTWGWESSRGAQINGSAKIKNCIIHEDAKIGADVSLTNVIVGPGVIIEDGTKIQDTVINGNYSSADPTIIGAYSIIEKMIIMGGKLEPHSEVRGVGGEMLYVPETGMFKLPAEQGIGSSIDDKRADVLDGFEDKEFAQLCIGGMPTKHLQCASVERLSAQIGHIMGLYNEINSDVHVKEAWIKPDFIVTADNSLVSDATEITIIGKDSPALLGFWLNFMSREIMIDSKPFPLSIKTDWGIRKNDKKVLIFEVTDENGQNLSNEQVAQVLAQMRGKNISELYKG